MATVGAEVEIAAEAAAVWDLYFDADRWRDWVDQFASAVSSDGYPQVGGTLVWRSGRAGRGEVTERVAEHEPRHRHRIAFSDPEAEGELVTTFEPTAGGTRMPPGAHVRASRPRALRPRSGPVLRALADAGLPRPLADGAPG